MNARRVLHSNARAQSLVLHRHTHLGEHAGHTLLGVGSGEEVVPLVLRFVVALLDLEVAAHLALEALLKLDREEEVAQRRLGHQVGGVWVLVGVEDGAQRRLDAERDEVRDDLGVAADEVAHGERPPCSACG